MNLPQIDGGGRTRTRLARMTVQDLHALNPDVFELLGGCEDLEDARSRMFEHLNACERRLLDGRPGLHSVEGKAARECIRVFKGILSRNNEARVGHSCLRSLWRLARDPGAARVSEGFLQEMKHLLEGIKGHSESERSPVADRGELPDADAQGDDHARFRLLDHKSLEYARCVARSDYRSGLHPEVVAQRERNRRRILEVFGADERDWDDPRWQLRYASKTIRKIGEIVELSDEERASIREAMHRRHPIHITPYYLSLLDAKPGAAMHDRSLRTQVVPNRSYLEKMVRGGDDVEAATDFMRETENSPVDLVTRRYPMISIVKPFPSCPQLCIYCQRNWEVKGNGAEADLYSAGKLRKAIEWFRGNPGISEVLITGGDPLTLGNDKLGELLDAFQEMPHIRRIRIGSRMLVTMPMRFEAGLVELLARHHRPPHQSISLMTHVQHAYEITPVMKEKVQLVRALGIDVFNQQVFTIQNCRRFETSFLRECLRAIGVSPYYLFNLKDKTESSFFKVPIARILQERKEEARLMSGLMRTDRAVFNIPTSGKNDLASSEDRELIMILDDGRRVYEFFPWEREQPAASTYLYTDDSIHDFLVRLEELGEDPADYRSIWSYY